MASKKRVYTQAENEEASQVEPSDEGPTNGNTALAMEVYTLRKALKQAQKDLAELKERMEGEPAWNPQWLDGYMVLTESSLRLLDPRRGGREEDQRPEEEPRNDEVHVRLDEARAGEARGGHELQPAGERELQEVREDHDCLQM